jgi:N-acetylmuramoyl-L-alanine amidase
VAGSAAGATPGSAEDQQPLAAALRPRSPQARPLAGRVVAIDPGHNGGNARAGSRIARLVEIGNGRKACDTTGAQTAGGYPESAFAWDVAARLAALLRQAGATVVLTRSDDTGVGPCITERASIGNRAHADAAISIHADGGPPAGYGFHVIEPASIGRNAAIVAPSNRLAVAVRTQFAAVTGEPFSTYTGGGRALTARTDLGGLNLSSVPKVFIECANLRNAADARRVTSPAWRQRAATALAAGLTAYLRSAAG